jgi:hypothetical protein
MERSFSMIGGEVITVGTTRSYGAYELLEEAERCKVAMLALRNNARWSDEVEKACSALQARYGQLLEAAVSSAICGVFRDGGEP